VLLLRLIILFVLALASIPAASAQDASAAWQGQMDFRREMEHLGREGHLKNPLILLDLECSGEGSLCKPMVRLFVRVPSVDMHRIPLLPTVSLKKGVLEVDKARFKREKKGDVFEAACEKLPVPDLCEGKWALRKIWKITELPETDYVDFTLKTRLLRPGASSTQIGSRTPEQVLVLRIPIGPIEERLVIPLWEQGTVLNMPETYLAR
jgi:hypothetical protein